MKLTRADQRHLFPPLTGCIVLILAAIAGGYFAQEYLDRVKRSGVATSDQLREVKLRLARATEEEREIKENLQHYQALIARGVVGEEKRLDWVDAVTAIKSERRLFNISYSIAPQKELDYPGFGKTPGVKFMASRVNMSLQLLHEEDLLGFIDELGRRAKTHLSVRECNLRRTPRPSGTALAPRLEADCAFDLITISHNKPN